MSWPVAARDHQTFCISCHTALPYALGRPALRKDLAEHGPSSDEAKLIANVTTRVRMWDAVEPFYKGGEKPVESRGTESILNALILTRYEPDSEDSRRALNQMWALQLKDGPDAGAWSWLQFHNSPWEGDSTYYGATLAAIATGSASLYPAGVSALKDYLLRQEAAQIPFDRVMLLWASAKLSGLLTRDQQKAIVDEAFTKQKPDGGFSLTSFVGGWQRHDGTPLVTDSDGLATALVTLAMQESGVPAANQQLRRALTWLASHQDKQEGRWLAYSLNKNRDLSTDVGKFMSDAATSFAVLSLEEASGQ